ncbi:MarR family winged helix-turn-helix transcriptional regulator [Nakamurella leprariae]|uniref:MarR family transcriptional regulator n=1 Tax=Nakamurella leprariae TaxID=2803911 RepID=A0A939C0R7_9ACTN|nr:MarR family transcriptional regulator [Nakamurella leprariae]MBM9469061.1 MarR family transcriptional regulator [Nakamurella leprariae]
MSWEQHEAWATGRLLSTAARLVENTWNARLRDDGVTHAGVVVLATLMAGPADQRVLARAQHVTEQTMGRTLAHLEQTGHITRDADPADRRRRVAQLTDRGRGLVASLSDRGERLTDDILRTAGQDSAALRAGLIALISALAGPGSDAQD